jgi:hypothetical protein
MAGSYFVLYFVMIMIMSQKATKGLSALKPEMECDQMAIGLPPIASALFLIAELFW